MFQSSILLPEGALLLKTQAVARAVRRAGGRAFLVGGYVRDALLGLSPKDADMEVYGLEAAPLRRVLERLGTVNCVGESFRVYKLVWHERLQTTPELASQHAIPITSRTDPSDINGSSAASANASCSSAANAPQAKPSDSIDLKPIKQRHELDVSLPRRDRKTGEGHRGFEVEGDPNASFEDACRRRDFTINALLCDPLDGTLIDPFGGAFDLENRLLRAVDPAHFAEDSLRVLRSVQFAARFEMQVEPSSVALCRAIDLSDLPRERIWSEWEKLLLKAARPSLGLVAANELDVLHKLFPALYRCMSMDATALCAALDRAARERDLLARDHEIDNGESDIPESEASRQEDSQRAVAQRDAAQRDAAQRAKFRLHLAEKQIALMLAAIGVFMEKGEVEAWLERLGIKTISGYDVRAQVLGLCETARQPVQWFDSLKRGETVFEGDLRRVASRCEPRLLVHLARALGHEDAAAWFLARMRELGVEWEAPAPLLLGRHVLEMGLQPGPRIGQITRAVYEMQLDGTVSTHARAQEAARAMIEE